MPVYPYESHRQWSRVMPYHNPCPAPSDRRRRPSDGRMPHLPGEPHRLGSVGDRKNGDLHGCSSPNGRPASPSALARLGGRPGEFRLDSRPSAAAVRFTQCSAPNGVPRSTLGRNTACHRAGATPLWRGLLTTPHGLTEGLLLGRRRASIPAAAGSGIKTKTTVSRSAHRDNQAQVKRRGDLRSQRVARSGDHATTGQVRCKPALI